MLIKTGLLLFLLIFCFVALPIVLILLVLTWRQKVKSSFKWALVKGYVSSGLLQQIPLETLPGHYRWEGA